MQTALTRTYQKRRDFLARLEEIRRVARLRHEKARKAAAKRGQNVLLDDVPDDHEMFITHLTS